MDPNPNSCRTFALIERHRAGDPAALEELIEHYYPRIERMIRVRLGATLAARTTVADVVQDVFVRLLKDLDQFEPREDARWIDWIARLVQNELSNQMRRERTLKRSEPEVDRRRGSTASRTSFSVPAETSGVPSKVARDELARIVDECLTQLPEVHREVILLRDYAGADWKDIAEKLQRPSPEACQELYRRARNDLGDRVRRRVG